MYPLKEWQTLPRGYKHGDDTFYGSKHLGVDIIVDEGTPVYAHMNGTVATSNGKQGGFTAHFLTSDGTFRYMHLSEFGKKGQVNKGDIIGYTGNTGELTTAPHLHADQNVNDEYVDIEEYFLSINKMYTGQELEWFVSEGWYDKAKAAGIESVDEKNPVEYYTQLVSSMKYNDYAKKKA
jgi:murein DD-endopeptidase MepM/ murein hydrolase activator NlpD